MFTQFKWFFRWSYHRPIVFLAAPMIISNITTPLLGLVDTAVLGHLSAPSYLAGVALSGTIITIIFWLMGFLRMGTTGLVANAFGAKNHQSIITLLMQSVILALIISLFLILTSSVWFDLGMALSEASGAVANSASDYYEIRIWSAPFTLLNLVMLGWLMALQRAKYAMYCTILANLVNLVLDLYLVLELGWGVKGAAIASLVSEIIITLLLTYFTLQTLKAVIGDNWSRYITHFKLSGISRLISLNRDIFLRSLCLQVVFAFMTFEGGRIGEITLAANAILLNFLMFTAYALDGFAYSAEALVGKSMGQRSKESLNRNVLLSLFWSTVSALLFCVVYVWQGENILALMTSIDSVKAVATNYLPWLMAMPLVAVLCYLMDGVYIGAARGDIMRNSMFVCSALFFGCYYSLPITDNNHRLWAALSLFMLLRGISLLAHYILAVRQQRFIV